MSGRRRFAVLALALAVRMTWALLVGDPMEFPDSGAYASVARNLAEGRGFSVDECWQFAVPYEFWGRGYVAYYPPGYPAFLAALRLAGLGSPRAVACAQAFVSTATVWLVMALARRLFGERAELAAGAIAAVEPHLVFFAGHLLTETLFTLLLTASLVFLTESGGQVSRAGRAGDPTSGEFPERALRGASWGALAALAALVRVTHLAFMPLAALADVLVSLVRLGRAEARRRIGFHLVGLGVFVALLAPWTIRNAVRLGGFVPGTTQLGAALWDAFGPEADGGSDMTGVAWPQELRPLGELERDRLMRREAAREVARRPFRAAALAFRKLARLWSPVARAEGYTTAPYLLAGAIAYLILIGGAFAGGAFYRREWVSWWPTLAPAAYITAFTCIFAGSIRFRVPAEAALAVLAGAGYAELWERLRARVSQDGANGPCRPPVAG